MSPPGQERDEGARGLTVVGTGAPLALLVVAHRPEVAVALVAVSGAASMVGEVVATGWLRQAVPSALAGRAFGVLESLAVAAMLLGTSAAPVLVDAVGLRAALVVGGLGVPAATLALVARVHPSRPDPAGHRRTVPELLEVLS